MVQELRYDAWGGLQNGTSEMGYNYGAEPALFLGRGYTGHEHLFMFELINMNARLYDNRLGRFLSPDPYVTNPFLSQDYNRYSYARNNPMAFTDQDGENPLILLIGLAVLGAYVGGVSSNHGELNPVQWNYKDASTWLGMTLGALTGYYAGYGILNPGTINFVLGAVSPWGAAAASVGVGGAAIGAGTDWKYEFSWTTSAGGGGQVGNVDNSASIKAVDKGFYNARNAYNYSYMDNRLGETFYTGTGASAVGEVFFSKELGTWMGKDLKIRSQDWGGNGFTGGKYKFAGNLSKVFKYGSIGLGAYDMFQSGVKASKGQIYPEEAIGDWIFGGFAMYSGVYGGVANFSYNLGKEYGPLTNYLRTQERKRTQSEIIDHLRRKGMFK